MTSGKPPLSAIRAMIAAQSPDQTPEGRDKLAIKLGFMAKHDPVAYARPKRTRAKKKSYTEEESLQLTIISYIRTQPRLLCNYNHKQVFRGKATWAQINYIEKQKRLGVLKGISDITGIFLGRSGTTFIAAELKAKGGTEEEDQDSYIKDVEKRGGYGAFIYSLDDFIGLLERAGYWK